MFAERLKELRKAHKITQVELAKELNVAKGTVAMWETSPRHPVPDAATLEKLCTLFDCRMDYLLGYTDDKSPYSKFIRIEPSTEHEEELKRLADRMRNGEIMEDTETIAPWSEPKNTDPDGILKNYNRLDEYGKSAVRRMIRDELKRCKEQGTLK